MAAASVSNQYSAFSQDAESAAVFGQELNADAVFEIGVGQSFAEFLDGLDFGAVDVRDDIAGG